jgi:hypothetical protein
VSVGSRQVCICVFFGGGVIGSALCEGERQLQLVVSFVSFVTRRFSQQQHSHNPRSWGEGFSQSPPCILCGPLCTRGLPGAGGRPELPPGKFELLLSSSDVSCFAKDLRVSWNRCLIFSDCASYCVLGRI